MSEVIEPDNETTSPQIPTPDDFTAAAETREAAAQNEQAAEKIQQEVALRACLAKKLIAALNKHSGVEKPISLIIDLTDEPIIRPMFTNTILNSNRLPDKYGHIYNTIRNPDLAASQALLNKILSEYGWTGRISEDWESTGYSMSTRSEGSRATYTLYISPLPKRKTSAT